MLIRQTHITTMNTWYTLSLFFHLVGLVLCLRVIAVCLVVFGTVVHDLQPGLVIRILINGRTSLEAISWAGIGLLLISGIINLILRNQAPGVTSGRFYTIVLAIKL